MTQVNLKYRRTDGVSTDGALLTTGLVLVSPAYRYDTTVGEMTTEPLQAAMGATITLAPGPYLFDPVGVPDGRGGFLDMKAYRLVPASGTPIDVDDLTEVQPTGLTVVGEEWKVYVDQQIAGVVAGTGLVVVASSITDSTVTGRALIKAADAAAGRTAIAAAPLAHTHPVADIAATGAPTGANFLRGDGRWDVPTVPPQTWASITGKPTSYEPAAAWTQAIIVQSGGTYPSPLPTGFASLDRGSVDPATQFPMINGYKWVQVT